MNSNERKLISYLYKFGFCYLSFKLSLNVNAALNVTTLKFIQLLLKSFVIFRQCNIPN